jgi:hypothetical protein
MPNSPRSIAARRPRAAVLALVPALAALSLLLPYGPGFDPWAWLIWGREIAGGDLDTAGGASWKPGPVLLTTPFSLLGDLAPELWLWVARCGWLTALALAGRLAWRLTRERGSAREAAAAAGIAAVGLLLLADAFTPWLRQAAIGLSEPLLVALILGAIEAQLSRRRGLALGLAVGAALLRPEAWPLLALFALWLWRRRELPRPAVAAALLAVPLLWLVPDLLGSGSPLTGAERARADTSAPLANTFEALGRALNLAPAALLAACGWLVWERRRDGERVVMVLAAGALAWTVIVTAMAAAGYAGLPRFAAPVGAIVCVLGAVGLVELRRRPGAARWTAAALAALLLAQGAQRASELPGDLGSARELAGDTEALFELVEAVGPAALLGCGALSTTDVLTEAGLAWKLEVPATRIGQSRSQLPARGVALIGPAAEPSAAALATRAEDAGGEPLAASGRWRAYAISCSARRSSISGPGPSSAGVEGARR